DISHEDYHVTDHAENALDLLLIVRKWRDTRRIPHISDMIPCQEFANFEQFGARLFGSFAVKPVRRICDLLLAQLSFFSAARSPLRRRRIRSRRLPTNRLLNNSSSKTTHRLSRRSPS